MIRPQDVLVRRIHHEELIQEALLYRQAKGQPVEENVLQRLWRRLMVP